jgi:hypothetical protein
MSLKVLSVACALKLYHIPTSIYINVLFGKPKLYSYNTYLYTKPKSTLNSILVNPIFIKPNLYVNDNHNKYIRTHIYRKSKK